ncbi:hypothetical protein CyaNS01_00187 [Cyanobium sp. NS01]|nr:hypothetical protein CyaNS01_00187 [Cyanobium sp. NS01]
MSGSTLACQALDPESQITLEPLGRDQYFSILIKIQIKYEAEDEDLYRCIIPVAVIGRYAAEAHVLSADRGSR